MIENNGWKIMIGLRWKCWQIKRFLLQISSQHQKFSEEVIFERKQRQNGTERQHVLQTKTDGNNGLLRLIQNTSFHIFISLMWLEFISLMCFHRHHCCRNVIFWNGFASPFLFKQRKREIVLLLLQLCLYNTQWVDTFVGSFILYWNDKSFLL